MPIGASSCGHAERTRLAENPTGPLLPFGSSISDYCRSQPRGRHHQDRHILGDRFLHPEPNSTRTPTVSTVRTAMLSCAQKTSLLLGLLFVVFVTGRSGCCGSLIHPILPIHGHTESSARYRIPRNLFAASADTARREPGPPFRLNGQEGHVLGVWGACLMVNKVLF